MSEENKQENKQEKKWTEWSVVNMNDGSLRCRRTNAEDKDDVEYRAVPRPVFSPEELAGMIGFGKLELLESDRIAYLCYERRYRGLAFRMCGELNAQPGGAS